MGEASDDALHRAHGMIEKSQKIGIAAVIGLHWRAQHDPLVLRVRG